jgi:hypothetical protein
MKTIACIVLCLFFSAAQADWRDYRHLSPKPQSTQNTRESTIIIRPGSLIDPASLADGLIRVSGDQSGPVGGRISLSSDQGTLLFKPGRLFEPGEIVSVNLSAGIRTRDGAILPECAFSFQIAPSDDPFHRVEGMPDPGFAETRASALIPGSRPAGIPQITSVIYDPAAVGEGKLLLSCYGQLGLNFKGDPNDSAIVMILNNDGSVWKMKNIGSTKGVGLTDFKMQPSGYFSYPKVLKSLAWTGGGEVIHMVMDPDFAVVDSFQMGNGYVAETHDFRMLANGHALLMGYYLTPIDLSRAVNGGHPNAWIDGAVVQELDADKNVVFQWRTWDYFDIDRVPWALVPNNTQQIVNVFHLNAISLDMDGNLLLGTPGMGLKVSRQTGEILWIAGGFMNQFTFTNVPLMEGIGDLGGHTFQRLDNGNFLIYDNSPFPWQPGASTVSAEAVEYRLDETNRTAERIWKYTPSPMVSGWHAGSAQRLPNGNTVIGWGGPSAVEPSLIMTEVSASGQKVMDLYFNSGQAESYRVYRMPVNTGEADAKVTVAEVSPGNIYSFTRGDSVDTGIRIKVNSYSGSGYNEIRVARYGTAPQSAEFLGKAPRVNAGRIVTAPFAISDLDGDIRFHVDKWGIREPEKTLIYYREFENNGLFMPLSTSYNYVTREVIGAMHDFGEFIVAVPDLESLVLEPVPFEPPDSGSVNQTLPVVLRWNPVGAVGGYALQVAMDAGFTQLVADETSLTEALYRLASVDENATYFWRVKSFNDAGESDWSRPVSFRTVPPSITVLAPNGGEAWQRGLPHVIAWKSNFLDPVVLGLCRRDTVIGVIDTVADYASTTWEIDPRLDIGLYRIRASSVLNDSLFDFSDAVFSVIDTVGGQDGDTTRISDRLVAHQNRPNPFFRNTTIGWEQPSDGQVKITIYDLLGRERMTVLNEVMEAGPHMVPFDGSPLASGVYIYVITTPSDKAMRKMILIR